MKSPISVGLANVDALPSFAVAALTPEELCRGYELLVRRSLRDDLLVGKWDYVSYRLARNRAYLVRI